MPRQSKIRAVCVALMLMAPVAAAQSIDKAIQSALRAYPTIGGADQRRVAQQLGIERAKAARIPTVGWESTAIVHGGNGDDFEPIEGVVARMPLYAGGAIQAGIREQEALYAKATQESSLVRDEVALGAAGAYLAWYQSSISVVLAERNLETISRIVADVGTVAEADPGRRADYDQALVRQAKAQQELDRQQSGLAQAQATYLRYFGVPAPSDANLADAADLKDERLDTALPPTLAQALSRASAHPQIEQARAATLAGYEGISVARARIKPQVGLAVGSGDNGTVELTFSWTGFDVAARRGIAAAAAEAAAGEYDIEDARLIVEEGVRRAWAEMEGARRRQEPAMIQVETGARVVEAYRDQFLIGKRTLLDLLNASDEVFTNEISALQADMDFRFARYRVMAAIGELAQHY